MKPISSLLFPLKPQKRTRRTERGDLIDYLYSRLKPHWKGKTELTRGFIRYKLTNIPTKDLYYIKSGLDEREGLAGAKWFWWSVK